MANPTPPKLLLRLFKWFCDPNLHQFIEGDLLELYLERVSNLNKKKADLRFTLDVLMLFRPGIVRSFDILHHISIQLDMFYNYLKVAWRNLLKQKLVSFINISGLTVGLVCFMLLMLYAQYELSYDKHHDKSGQIYRVIQKQEGNTFRGTDLFAVSPEPLAPAMLENFPEVEAAATINDPRYASETVILSHKEKVFSPKVLYADENLFSIFPIPIVEGQGGDALSDPTSILLSQSLAKKYFDQDSPIGKELLFNNERLLTIRGVFEDLPENQHITFDYILAIENYANYKENLGRWGSNNYRTYVVLPKDYNHKDLEKKFSVFDDKIAEAYGNSPFSTKFILQPVEDIYLHSKANFESAATSDIRYIYLLISIAFIILLLAAINYMNLATAKSINRSKEVGMRKVLGAKRKQLITQLLGESFLLTSISFVFAIALVVFLLPGFNNMMGKEIPLTIIGSYWFLVAMLLSALMIGGFSGLYPALFLSGVGPLKAIKGSIFKQTGKDNLLRNSLVVGQFTAAIILTISGITVYQQLHYIQSKKLGYNREQVLYVPYYFRKIEENYTLIRSELMAHPQINKVALSLNLPIQTDNQGTENRWEGNDDNRTIAFYRHYIDYHFLDLYEIELLTGRGFSNEHTTDADQSYLLNEAAVSAIGWTPESTLGKSFRNGQVIGVVKDFHFEPMDLRIEPMYMVLRNPEDSFIDYGNISIKTSTDDLDGTIAHIQKTFTDIAPDIPFEYHFLDESYDHMYESEQRLSRSFTLFTLLAIFIACIGLFGLVSHTIVQRAKEIGIRKVLGASAQNILHLLSKDFLRLIMIAVLIGIPLAWYLMDQWLQDFAYRISLSGWIFLLTGLTVLGFALITISLQGFKVITTNPIESLREKQ